MAFLGHKLASADKPAVDKPKIEYDPEKKKKALLTFFGAFGLCACAGGCFAGIHAGTGNLGAAFGGAAGLLFAALGVAMTAHNQLEAAKIGTNYKVEVNTVS